jgi:hypothetical protein
VGRAKSAWQKSGRAVKPRPYSHPQNVLAENDLDITASELTLKTSFLTLDKSSFALEASCFTLKTSHSAPRLPVQKREFRRRKQEKTLKTKATTRRFGMLLLF